MLSGGFLNHMFIDSLFSSSNLTNLSFRYLIAYKNLLRAIENIGIAVVYGIRYIVIVRRIVLETCKDFQSKLNI